MSRLLLLDGHSLAYRAFFALPVGELLDHHRAAHQRGLRLHLDADQRAARRAADPRRRGLRRLAGRPSASRSTPSTRPAASATPSEFQGQVSLLHEVLDALRIPLRRGRGLRGRRRASPRSPRRPPTQGIEVLICSGDRDAFQLVTDKVTVLYPVKGVSELARMTPDAVEAKYGVPPGALQRPRRAGRRVQRQPARRARGRPQDRGQVDQPVRRPRPASSPTSTRSRARRASRCASTSTACCATAGSTSWSATSSCRVAVADLGAPGLGPRARCTRSSTAWSSGCCATGCSSTSSAPRRRPSAASTLDGSVLAAGRGRRRGWTSTPRPAPRVGVHVVGHLGRAAPATPTALALATDGGAAAYVDLTDARPGRRRRRCGAWLADADRAQGAARRQGAAAGAARPAGWPLRGRHQRHRAGGLPGPARPALLRPGRPRAAPPRPRAARRGRDRRPGHARLRRRRATPAARGRPWCGPARCSTWPASLDDAARGHRRHRAAAATSSCRWSTCWPAWSASASPPTSRR